MSDGCGHCWKQYRHNILLPFAMKATEANQAQS